MRHVAAVLAVALLFAVPVFADNQTANSLNSKMNEIIDLANQIKDLDSTTGKRLDDRKKNLDDTADLLKGAVDNLKPKYDDLEMRFEQNQAVIAQLGAEKDQLDAAITAHNGRCSGTFNDQSYVSQCNSEASSLNNQKIDLNNRVDRANDQHTSLVQEGKDLDDYKTGLKQRYDQLSQDTLDWAAQVKQYNADRNELAEKFNAALAQLKQLAGQLQNCIDRLPASADDEQIKHFCGNVQFDGVRANLPRLRDIDPATIMPEN